MKVEIEFSSDDSWCGVVETTLAASEIDGQLLRLKTSIKDFQEGTTFRVIKAHRGPCSAHPDTQNWVHVHVVPDDRPGGIKCVADIHEDNKGKTWCGRRIDAFEWHFEDVDHAALNGRNKGRPVACVDCVAAITESLGEGI